MTMRIEWRVTRTTLTSCEVEAEYERVHYVVKAEVSDRQQGSAWLIKVLRPFDEWTSDLVAFDCCATREDAIETARRLIHEVHRQCPCCGYLTLSGRGRMEICPICGWRDTNDRDVYLAVDDAGWPYANGVRLWQAQANVLRYGAARPEWRKRVRLPTVNEIPTDHIEMTTLFRDTRTWEGDMTVRRQTFKVLVTAAESRDDPGWKPEVRPPGETGEALVFGAYPTMELAILAAMRFVQEWLRRPDAPGPR